MTLYDDNVLLFFYKVIDKVNGNLVHYEHYYTMTMDFRAYFLFGWWFGYFLYMIKLLKIGRSRIEI